LDAAKAEQNARRFGGKPYTDYREMIRAEKPEAVIVCIGPEAHATIAADIMQMGIPVYTEKPPAPTSELAYELALLSKSTGLLNTTAFKKRYSTAFQRAKQWLSQFPEQDYVSLSMD